MLSSATAATSWSRAARTMPQRARARSRCSSRRKVVRISPRSPGRIRTTSARRRRAAISAGRHARPTRRRSPMRCSRCRRARSADRSGRASAITSSASRTCARSRQRPFEEVRAELEAEYRRDQAQSIFYERSQQLADESFAALSELDSVARKLGLPLLDRGVASRATAAGRSAPSARSSTRPSQTTF